MQWDMPCTGCSARLEQAAAVLHVLLQHGRQPEPAGPLPGHQLLHTLHLPAPLLIRTFL